ncbi:uncharacterized protein LOC123673309 [Harmonia axyridis]|uniref:uncharacterized protein LOC123673309 n=1 Tax=Harmonia axyridis TaxID=115357 RepID=UPI001E278A39|nr:uncharacterized protein LOC123673309 [Harmonia axyridis]
MKARGLFRTRLDEKLTDGFREQRVEEVYENMVNSIKKAAEEALGLWRQKASNKLWWTEEIEDLIAKKKSAYLKWISSREQEDKEVYMAIKRTTRQSVTAAKRQMWDRKCQEVNSYTGGRKCSETWKFIGRLKANEKVKTNIELRKDRRLEGILWTTTLRK